MGYDTRFKGEIKIEGKISKDIHNFFESVENYEYDDDVQKFVSDETLIPDSYCQWILVKRIHSNGDYVLKIDDESEKFYYYIEWLEVFLKYVFIPNGNILNGTILWQGEDIEDRGVISIINNIMTVKRYETQETIESLQARIKALEGENEFLKSKNISLDYDIDDLKKENENLKSEINSLYWQSRLEGN